MHQEKEKKREKENRNNAKSEGTEMMHFFSFLRCARRRQRARSKETKKRKSFCAQLAAAVAVAVTSDLLFCLTIERSPLWAHFFRKIHSPLKRHRKKEKNKRGKTKATQRATEKGKWKMLHFFSFFAVRTPATESAIERNKKRKSFCAQLAAAAVVATSKCLTIGRYSKGRLF